MKKSKYGYLLLGLLVITGLAGMLKPASITNKERKFAVNILKETRAEALNEIKGLSDAQLNFKPAQDRWSVKECMYHIAISETNLWPTLENAMKQPANPEKRSEIKMTDEQVIKTLEDRSFKVKTQESFEPANTSFKTATEAVEYFKKNRNEHIKYMKNTTEDLRNHIIQTPLGWIDCYQFCLFIAAHTNRHVQQMQEVKASEGYPK